ncbi:MAG: hypothetical protein RJA07_2499 [Bacteroidota bacterium]|jgi:hypothetical protein
MTIEHKISTLVLWSEEIKLQIANSKLNVDSDLKQIMLKAYYHNNWFTEQNILLALNNICNEFLDKKKLEEWVKLYFNKQETNNKKPKTIGITMAGNLPLVGFHDLLCVLVSNHTVMIKLSSKDNLLLPYLLNILFAIEPEFKNRIIISEMLKGADAYIATGSNNSARYFEHYFGKYPNIIRKNRTSIALLDGSETDDDIMNLGKDVFTYFGLGCRNVGKIYITKSFDLQRLLRIFEHYNHLADHVKYRNNYDYQLTILLMNKTVCLVNDCIIVTEDKSIHSPLSVLYFEVVDTIADALKGLNMADIQCIVGKNNIPFGQSQIPTLSDYADDIDTMKWVNTLN